ncbi:hypothetical protein [Micromonospora zamorensis]
MTQPSGCPNCTTPTVIEVKMPTSVPGFDRLWAVIRQRIREAGPGTVGQ